ncbi:WD repeat domain-containing protein [Cordyceps javanica]|nr:WD repeat domain-containing protein [Cordyceps javanica]
MALDAVENSVEDDNDVDAATYARRKYLDTQQVTLHSNPVIGAVQGPQYAASGLFLRDAHLDDDPAAPLVTKYERLQQESRHSVLGGAASHRRRSLRRLGAPPSAPDAATEQLHRRNVARDLDPAALTTADLDELVRAGALLDIGDEGEDWGFQYEDVPAAVEDDDSTACDTEPES